jgi:signal transduction histidine kinase
VTDAGIGMTPAQVARVFERFYRADPSGAILGTGLGMSIAKEIVDLHGGSLVVTSAPGQGTCVSVWLPLVVHALASSR